MGSVLSAKFFRRQPAQGAVRTPLVVVLSPGFNCLTGIMYGWKHILIQTEVDPIVRRQSSSTERFHPPIAVAVWHQGLASHRICCAIYKMSRPRCRSVGTNRQRALLPRLAAISQICSSVNLLRFILVLLYQEHELFNGILFGGRVKMCFIY